MDGHKTDRTDNINIKSSSDKPLVLLFKEKVKALRKPVYTSRQKLVTALCVNLFLAFTLFFFAPLEMYLSDSADFLFNLNDLLLTLIPFCILYVILATGLCMLLNGVLFDLAVMVLFTVTFLCYLQGNFLNGVLPVLDGTQIQWTKYAYRTLLNTGVWILLTAAVCFLYYCGRRAFHLVVKILSAAAAAMQLTALVFLLLTTDASPSYFLTEEKMFELSDKENVIVFILDRLDYHYMDKLLEEDPGFLEPFRGFVHYENAVSQYPNTALSLPFMMTGYAYDFSDSYGAYLEKAWENAEFLQKLKEDGYDIRLLTDTAGLGRKGNAASALVDNIETSGQGLSRFGILKAMGQCVAFRYAPYPLKPIFWFYTPDLNMMARKPDSGASLYTFDDIRFYEALENTRLSVQNDKNCFRLYHLHGPHEPYRMSATATRTDKSSIMEQTRGCMYIVSQYLDQLKALGLYDDTTVIITSDHGDWAANSENDPETGVSRLRDVDNPVMIVKYAGSTEDDPLVTSSAPVSHQDLFSTILDSLGDPDYETFGSSMRGIPEDQERQREFYYFGHMDYKKINLRKYLISGDANDFSSWSLDSQVYPIPPDMP